MHCLLVSAHPLAGSLCHTLVAHIHQSLTVAGHTVVAEDLYANNFEPALSPAERQSYYAAAYDTQAVAECADRLLNAQALVLVFPTWWFGFPAILKGWFDRVWAPGVAYDHAKNFGPITPRLMQLRRVLVVTTLGSPWWVDKLVMWQPVKRILKTAILGTCVRGCQFDMLSLYQSEQLTPAKVQAFQQRITAKLQRWQKTQAPAKGYRRCKTWK